MRITIVKAAIMCVALNAALEPSATAAQTTHPSRVVAPTAGTAPAASRVRTAAQAAALLRRLFFFEQANEGAGLGDTLVRRYPASGPVRAWYVANLARAGDRTRAESLVARIDTSTRDPWLIATRALGRMFAVTPSNSSFAEAHRLALRAHSLAPRDSDLAWIAAYTFNTPGFVLSKSSEIVAYVDSVGPKVGNPGSLRVLRADALLSTSSAGLAGLGTNATGDTVKRAAAFREYAAIRAGDSTNFEAFYNNAWRLNVTQPETALVLMNRAVALAPRSPVARAALWRMIDAQRGISASAKRRLISADRAAFLAQTDSALWAMLPATQSMRRLAPDSAADFLEDRILARAPHSTFAEDVLLRRAMQWNDSLFAARDTTRPGPRSDTAMVHQRYLDAMEAFIAKPWVANPATVNQAVLSLFFSVREDSTYPTEKMVPLVKRLLDPRLAGAPSFRYAEAAKVLSARKVEFPLAEQAARQGLKETAKYLREFPGYVFTSVGEQADALDGANATLHDAIGLVFYHAGRYADADTEMSRAVELNKKSVDIYRDLGRLRVAQGRNEDAELAFAQGMTLRSRGVNPNQKELEAIYQRNHGSMDGWSAYLNSLVEKERAARRTKILATRDTSPKGAAPFRLADLKKKVVDSDSLRSKYTVVNFWGTWCGPCVAEMPELQQFYDKYRGDSTVAILTISNDKDLADLQEWMTKRKLTIPTLFDDGYVANTAQIHVFPTTWFIDPDGKVQFSAIGNTGALVEEWTWRLEALRAGFGRAVPIP